MNNAFSCPIWCTPTTCENYRTDDNINVDSPRAGGKYWMDGRSEQKFTDLNKDPDNYHTARVKARLTSWLIEQRRLGIERPRVNLSRIEDAEHLPDLPVHKRADYLLQYVDKKTTYIGSGFNYPTDISDRDTMELLGYTESTNVEEINHLIRYLRKQGWLEFLEVTGNPLTITVSGYTRLEVIENTVLDSQKAFVAMWFDKSMNEPFEKGFKAGIKDAGYEVIRIDEQEHVDRIDDKYKRRE